MARPMKRGLDYMNLDCNPDSKLKLIRATEGVAGYGLIILLFQRIYSEGFWIHWDDEEALLFADENRVEFEVVERLIETAFKRNVFSKELFDKYSILTSKGVQKRYCEATKRRKEVKYEQDFLLIDLKSLGSTNHVIVDVNSNPVNNNGVNVYNNPTQEDKVKHDDNKSTQSKVKESKVKKSKVKKLKEYGAVIRMTEEEFGKLIALYGEATVKDECDTADNWLLSKGKKYKDYYAFMNNWLKRKFKQEGNGNGANRQGYGRTEKTHGSETLKPRRSGTEITDDDLPF